MLKWILEQCGKKLQKRHEKILKNFRQKSKKGENFSPGAINILYLFLAAVLELYCNWFRAARQS